jgi:hypothetical protein
MTTTFAGTFWGTGGIATCSTILAVTQPTTAPASCTFNNQSIADGQSVTAYQAAAVPNGTQYTSEQRTCHNGTLDGTYQYASCFVATATCAPDPSSPQTQTLSCPTGQTGSITQTRTSSCPGPTWSAWTTTSNTCMTPPPSCTPNWSCSAWNACSATGSQSRTCTDTNTCGVTTGEPALTQSCTSASNSCEVFYYPNGQYPYNSSPIGQGSCSFQTNGVPANCKQWTESTMPGRCTEGNLPHEINQCSRTDPQGPVTCNSLCNVSGSTDPAPNCYQYF